MAHDEAGGLRWKERLSSYLKKDHPKKESIIKRICLINYQRVIISNEISKSKRWSLALAEWLANNLIYYAIIVINYQKWEIKICKQ